MLDPQRLDRCLALFPPNIRIAVELRHDSWWTPEVEALLTRRGAALCWADVKSRPRTPLWKTASWGYLRMHQGAGQPWPRYGDQALRRWGDRLSRTWPDQADVYVYFNNDPGGAAVRDAARLARVVEGQGRTVPLPS
jgi:uncharacterized protein YecE (DUF72 family)